jgi:hypothetical protein
MIAQGALSLSLLLVDRTRGGFSQLARVFDTARVSRVVRCKPQGHVLRSPSGASASPGSGFTPTMMSPASSPVRPPPSHQQSQQRRSVHAASSAAAAGVAASAAGGADGGEAEGEDYSGRERDPEYAQHGPALEVRQRTGGADVPRQHAGPSCRRPRAPVRASPPEASHGVRRAVRPPTSPLAAYPHIPPKPVI